MTENTQDDPDFVVRQGYRQAAQMQDERASETTRQAILAAAARAAQAGPRALETAAVKASFTRLTSTNWLSFRQPLAMAATLVFAVGVGLILFEQEQGVQPTASTPTSNAIPNAVTRSGPAVSAISPEAQPAQEVRADVATSDLAAPHAPVLRQAPAKARVEAETKTTIRADKAESKVQAQAGVVSVPSAPAATNMAVASRPDSAPIVVPSAPAPAVPQDVRAAAERSSAANVATTTTPLATANSMPRKMMGPTARERLSMEPSAGSAADAVRDMVRAPADWLATIIQLRKNGKSEEAERELQAFRLAYPQIEVPREALP